MRLLAAAKSRISPERESSLATSVITAVAHFMLERPETIMEVEAIAEALLLSAGKFSLVKAA